MNDIESIGTNIIIFFEGVDNFGINGSQDGLINIFFDSKQTELHDSKEG
jgi:hypothetical protein